MANLEHPLRRAITALGIAVLAAACGQWDDSTKARDVARELLACFDIEVERTEAHRFHATGCDRHADIVCSEGSLEPVCIRVRERGGAPPLDDQSEEESVAVALTPDGASLEEVEPDPLADDEAPDDDTGAIRTSGGELSAAEAAIRRGLDLRAGDVMACVDRDRVAVRVTHHSDGTVRVALTGDLSGTPEEGCVRAALGDVRAPTGASGVVLHLVRRPVSPEPGATDAEALAEPLSVSSTSVNPAPPSAPPSIAGTD